jgi:hypothetical protein
VPAAPPAHVCTTIRLAASDRLLRSSDSTQPLCHVPQQPTYLVVPSICTKHLLQPNALASWACRAALNIHTRKRCWCLLSVSQSAARCSLASSATATVAAAAAQCASRCGTVEADAAVACCRSCCHSRARPRRQRHQISTAPADSGHPTCQPRTGQPDPRSCPHTLPLPLPAAAAAATATAAAAAA